MSETKWQPIETAPKDPDLFVLLWGPLDAEWGDLPTELGSAFAGVPEISMGYWSRDAYWFVPNFGGPGDYEKYCRPTHWQPLPDPPA